MSPATGSTAPTGEGTPTVTTPTVLEVLPWMDGAWVRSARAYGGGPPGECSDVVWVQVGRWFADFRLPRPGVSASHPFDRVHAFSGVLEVFDAVGTSATVRWHHDLDTDHTASDGPGDGGSPDAGRLALGGGLLVESGDDYVEWWRRPAATEDGPPGWVVEHVDPVSGPNGPVDCRMACADGMAVAVWSANGAEGAGGAWCDPMPGWVPRRLTGSVCPFDLAAVGIAASSGDGLPDGWRRLVAS
jgi:hypothetical protein